MLSRFLSRSLKPVGRQVALQASFASSSSAGPAGIGFSLTPEQKELQELARKFTAQEIIPKVCPLRFGH
jgi:hypothetical protein